MLYALLYQHITHKTSYKPCSIKALSPNVKQRRGGGGVHAGQWAGTVNIWTATKTAWAGGDGSNYRSSSSSKALEKHLWQRR